MPPTSSLLECNVSCTEQSRIREWRRCISNSNKPSRKHLVSDFMHQILDASTATLRLFLSHSSQWRPKSAMIRRGSSFLRCQRLAALRPTSTQHKLRIIDSRSRREMCVWKNEGGEMGSKNERLFPFCSECPITLVVGNDSIDSFWSACMGGCDPGWGAEVRSAGISICTEKRKDNWGHK